MIYIFKADLVVGNLDFSQKESVRITEVALTRNV